MDKGRRREEMKKGWRAYGRKSRVKDRGARGREKNLNATIRATKLQP